jgi:hypothetical protein
MANAVNPAIIPGIPVAAIATNQNFKLKSGLGSGNSFWLTVLTFLLRVANQPSAHGVYWTRDQLDHAMQ